MKRSPPPRRRVRLHANPETARAWLDRSRRNPGNTIPGASRDAVRFRSGGMCEFPGCRAFAEVMHHRIPRRARDHSPGALLHLCDSHHRWIHANPSESYRLGYLVRGT
jgi:hypothetical protein